MTGTLSFINLRCSQESKLKAYQGLILSVDEFVSSTPEVKFGSGEGGECRRDQGVVSKDRLVVG